jgi:hypothetical protein
MIVNITLHKKHSIHTLYILLDMSVQGNFLSQAMAIKEGFQANSTSIDIIAIDGHSIAMYDKHIIKMKITNFYKECRISNVEFIAMNIK